MMTTCRLLCALLVLAMCCCPSVCAEENAGTPGTSQKTTTTTTQAPESKTDVKPEAQAHVSVTSPLSPPSGTVLQGKGEQGLQGTGSALGPGKAVLNGDRGGPTGPDPQSNDVSTTAPIEGTDDTTGTQSDISISAGQADNNSEASAQKTTTTTAPEAPTTTTTEAPTTTTTHAPSHLREIDGSLSSSAWVCSPLLLAVSALAYTTVG
ncbi:hypothetical protein TcYC6_0008190 [Trypanosoma cruzi]|nr:hypothetical protein TcYC6_0008190 [Trypanosoma cruzi]